MHVSFCLLIAGLNVSHITAAEPNIVHAETTNLDIESQDVYGRFLSFFNGTPDQISVSAFGFAKVQDKNDTTMLSTPSTIISSFTLLRHYFTLSTIKFTQ